MKALTKSISYVFYFIPLVASFFFSFKSGEPKSDVISVKYLCNSQKIQWTTSKEIKNNFFKIQGSNNSFTWSNLRTKKGKGHLQQSGYQKYQIKIS